MKIKFKKFWRKFLAKLFSINEILKFIILTITSSFVIISGSTNLSDKDATNTFFIVIGSISLVITILHFLFSMIQAKKLSANSKYLHNEINKSDKLNLTAKAEKKEKEAIKTFTKSKQKKDEADKLDHI